METECVSLDAAANKRFALLFLALTFAVSLLFPVDASARAEEETEAGFVPVSTSDWLRVGSGAQTSKLEFRVDSASRFIRRERETEYKSSTIFCDDYVFDFVGDNGEIVIYSFSYRKFALIDPIRRSRTEIDESEIDRFLERVKPILRDRNDGFTAFMTEPKFEISEKENELFFQSKWIDYRATTREFDDENVADAYFQFMNALGKLNVYMNPGVVTPLARLEANRKLEEEARFPEKIVAEIYPQGKSIFAKTAKIQNEASLAKRLSERDRNRMNRAMHFVEQFPFVNFRTYFEQTSKR